MIALAAVFTAWIFIEVLRLPEKYKWLKKPFNCLMCLSFWLAVVLFFLPSYVSEFLFYTTLAAALGAWLDK